MQSVACDTLTLVQADIDIINVCNYIHEGWGEREKDQEVG